jgi:hypothetical protein
MSLSIHEWPSEVIPYMHERIFDISIFLRKKSGCVMIPSPNPKAHVRFDNTRSLHSVGEDKSGFAYATDFFGRNDQATTMHSNILSTEVIGGYGIYFDSKLNGKKVIMYHIDDYIQRGSRIMWVCPDQKSREYIYYHKDPAQYLHVLANQFEQMKSW